MSTPRSVHPHIRGACIQPDPAVHFQPGSSPHTWGIRLRSHTHRFGSAVHPHIRGAYKLSRTSTSSPHGSSPHTWGILCDMARKYKVGRFIPTYVGHTYGMDNPLIYKAVHPHIRGAYYGVSIWPMGQGGSSPHTWGIRRLSLIHGACVRFIPTYVRHTSAAGAPGIAGAGSSPHTWGIPASSGAAVRRSRFIPTYVGHTSAAQPTPSTSTVHPHIRGAYGIRGRNANGVHGSSPHTWGILQ